jgi:hypothetical protein
MQAGADSRHTLQDPIDQRYRKLQFFSGIVASCQRRTHEGPGLALGKYEFRQHRFVELDEVHPLRDQLGNFITQHTHDVFGQVFFGWIDLAHSRTNIARVRRYGPSGILTGLSVWRQKSQFVHRWGWRADPAHAGRIAHRGRDVEGLRTRSKLALSSNVEHFQERH